MIMRLKRRGFHLKEFLEIVSNNELLSKCTCRACWENVTKKKKKNPLLSYGSVWLHCREQVSMTDRLRERGDTGTLKEDIIQLMILSICMQVCQHRTTHLASASCLSSFPAVWPRQQISSQCEGWQTVTGSWEHTLLISHVFIQEYQISVRIKQSDTQFNFFFPLSTSDLASFKRPGGWFHTSVVTILCCR